MELNEDCLIAEAVKAGQTWRFAELVDKYKNKVYNLACHITGSPIEGQDLAQEIFLLIYKNIGSFKGESSLSTWIYRIALNRCLDWQRAQKRRVKFMAPWSGPSQDAKETIDPFSRITADQPTPEQQVIIDEEYKELHSAISKLPEKYKSVIILYHFEDMTYQQISDILGIPVRTAETRLYRGKQKLKQLLTEYREKEVKSYEYIRARQYVE